MFHFRPIQAISSIDFGLAHYASELFIHVCTYVHSHAVQASRLASPTTTDRI